MDTCLCQGMKCANTHTFQTRHLRSHVCHQNHKLCRHILEFYSFSGLQLFLTPQIVVVGQDAGLQTGLNHWRQYLRSLYISVIFSIFTAIAWLMDAGNQKSFSNFVAIFQLSLSLCWKRFVNGKGETVHQNHF